VLTVLNTLLVLTLALTLAMYVYERCVGMCWPVLDGRRLLLRKLKIITAAIAAAALLMAGAGLSAASAEDQYGIYYRHGRVFGKLIHYDHDRDLSIIYGSVFIAEPGGKWRLVESRKFHLVNPVGNDVRETLAATGRTVGAEGNLQVWPGQKEEVLAARSVEFSNYGIDTPPWYAFGKTIRTEKVYKFNLKNSVTDFVNILAGLRDSAGLPQDVRLSGEETLELAGRVLNPVPGDRIFAGAVKDEYQRKWNEKWCVAKDRTAMEDLRRGTGGWQFYEGALGYGNSYIAKAPLIRRDIVRFMDAVSPGGGAPEESGQAVMCAYITVSRNRDGKIVKVTASGALYDSVTGLLGAMKNPSGMNLETWRLEGWSEGDAEVMEGKLCWLSGSRVLVYKTDPETGKEYLVDQYFALSKHLTRDGFENVLDFGNKVIGEGGV